MGAVHLDTSVLGTLLLDETPLRLAEAIAPPEVATLGAIHLATAVQMSDSLDAVITFDRELALGAAHHGLTAIAPE